MVRKQPPSLSFGALNTVLRSAQIAEDDAKKILQDHKEELFRALNVSSEEKPTRDADEIRYRAGAKATESHPKPTSAELVCIDSLTKSLGLRQSDIAVLLRDFLIEIHGSRLSEFLSECDDFTEVASIAALQAFWMQEKRYAFSCLVTVLLCSTAGSDHPLHTAFDSFLADNKNAVKQVVVTGALSALALYGSSAKGYATGTGNFMEGWWVMELLFAYSTCIGIGPGDQITLLEAYSRLVQENRDTRPIGTAASSPGAAHGLLDGREATALFVASLNNTYGLDSMIRCIELATYEEQESDVGNRSLGELACDLQAIKRLDELLRSLEQFHTAETAVLAFSWSAFLRVRDQIGSGKADFGAESQALDTVGHMTYAVMCNVFAVLRAMSEVKLSIDDLLCGELYHCLWIDVSAFLTAFPPQSFAPAQVEEVVELSAIILSRIDPETTCEISERLWNLEASSHGIVGANLLLRLASGLYPQTFRPLVLLLTSLICDLDSAACAVDFLGHRLSTLTEAAEGYRQSLYALDDDDRDIWESLGDRSDVDVELVSKTLASTRPSSEDTMFVQAAEDLSESPYREAIKKGSVGVSDLSLNVVTWVLSWNGLGALDHILRVLLRLLGEHEGGYDSYVLDELLSSALQSLKFIDRVSHMGGKSLREDLLADGRQISVVANIVAELADPGDWAKGSWLTTKRRSVLLTASSSCLSSMVKSSRRRAQFALEQLGSSKNALPLHAALSSLGQAAFPAVAAISQIAALSASGTRLPNDAAGVISSVLGSVHDGSMSDSSESFRGPPRGSRVYTFLRSVALPLWLTTSVTTERDDESRSLYWMLPACGIHLFSSRANDVLNDPTVASVVGAIFTAACGTESCEAASDTEVYLFPALRAALVACYEALRLRNASLQESSSAGKSTAAKHAGGRSPQNGELSLDLTTLEKVLLKPDVMHAMALLSSSSVDKLRQESFYTQWVESEFRSFLPEFDDDQHLYLNAMALDDVNKGTATWQQWAEDMSARCLSLQFCCLSHLSRKSDITQVPWPTMDRSAFGKWRGGGEGIRKGYSRKISEGNSAAAVELIASVLFCGQRAAARSLMGPRPGAVARSALELTPSTSTGVKQEQTSHDEHSNAKELQEIRPAVTSESIESENEVLFAVVCALRKNRDSWIAKISHLDAAEGFEMTSLIDGLGQIALNIASSVRFLRIGWEAYSSKWFRECWKILNIWDLLASLLRCEGSSSKAGEKVDLGKALEVPYAWLRSGEQSDVMEEDVNLGDDVVVRKMGLSVDVSAAWKGIAADVMQIFSSELLVRASESLVVLHAQQNSSPDVSESKENKLSLELFNEPLFTSFGSVFTERWMHSLLNENSGFTQKKSLQESGSPGSSRHLSQRGDSGRPAATETLSCNLSSKIAKAIGLVGSQTQAIEFLNQFRHVGDVQMRFGVDYFFDVPAILNCLTALVPDSKILNDIVADLLHLNATMTRKDIHVSMVSAYSAMASAVLFADSFAPAPGVALTYSSPQFGGKLCRFLSRALVCSISSIAESTHIMTNACEMSKLMASLSARLTMEELEQGALTSVRFTETPQYAEKEYASAPLAQVCFSIDRTLVSLSSAPGKDRFGNRRLETIRWLLLVASRFVRGTAFREEYDVSALAKSAISSLRVAKDVPVICASASVAISAVLDVTSERKMDFTFAEMFDEDSVSTLLSAVAALARAASDKRQERVAAEAAGNLLLAVARIHNFHSRHQQKNGGSLILRHLSSGSVLSFLPSEGTTIPAYDANVEYRNPVHLVWCSVLQLSASAIVGEFPSSRNGDQNVRDILEFCTTNLVRIGRDSLDLSGDWPSSPQGTGATNRGEEPLPTPRHVTISRVEEAELAAGAMFQLSNHALHLQHNIPELLNATVTELIRYIYQVYRIIRAAPVERWVRPVTQQERDRSILLRSDREGSIGAYGLGGSPWAMSPPAGSAGTATPPRRHSPSQALRAAIGGGSKPSAHSFVPPSPGMPATPLSQSPMSTGPGVLTGGPGSISPSSPWGPYGSGLITGSNLHFGEEALRSLLRGLCSALGALRRFSLKMDVLFFGPSMALSEERPGLGVLVAIMYHACSEIQRGSDGERRDLLQMILDNALHMTMTHVAIYSEQGIVAAGVRDELRKRVGTVVSRMRKVVPPPPSFSIVHSKELDAFWQQLR